MTAHGQGEYGAAQVLLQEGLAILQELGSKHEIAESLEGLAVIAIAQAHPERAARLFGAAEGVCEAIGAPQPPVSRSERNRSVAAARAALDAAAFAVAWAEGRALSLEQAISFALKGDPSSRGAD
jgi:non-specific serine/threonine protein kinase